MKLITIRFKDVKPISHQTTKGTLVPVIQPDDYNYLERKNTRPKRSITTKILRTTRQLTLSKKQAKNNTKCFDIPSSKSLQFSNSFFVKTLIDWNHLEDSVVCATSVESFKSALTNRQ